MILQGFFTRLSKYLGKTICLVVVSKVINLLTGKRQGWIIDGPPKIQCTSPRKYCL
jgi:hypothetical protein